MNECIELLKVAGFGAILKNLNNMQENENLFNYEKTNNKRNQRFIKKIMNDKKRFCKKNVSITNYSITLA